MHILAVTLSILAVVCAHQHRCHVVYERGDRAGKQRHQYGHPHDVFGFAQKYLRQAVWHLGRDKIIDDYHGARYHHQHVPVDGGKQALYGQYARDQKDDRQRQGVSRTVFGLRYPQIPRMG